MARQKGNYTEMLKQHRVTISMCRKGPLLAPFVKARHFHWSQQRLAFVYNRTGFIRPSDGKWMIGL